MAVRLFSEILRLSAIGSILILAVMLLRLFFNRFNHRVSYFLWMIVLLRLLLPFSIPSEYGLIEEKKIQENLPAVFVQSSDTENDLTEHQSEALPITEELPGAGVTEIPQTEESIAHRRTVSYPTLTAVVWLCGSVFCVGYMLYQSLRLRREIDEAVRIEDGIWLSEHINSPFVYGIFNGRIYLPYHLNEEEKYYVLLHENYHRKRHDNLYLLVAYIALCVHWFNPLVWISLDLIRTDIEMSCDEGIMNLLGERENARYSEVLLDLSVKNDRALSLMLTFGEENVKGRIRNVMHYRKPGAVLSVLFICLTVVISFFLLTNRQSEIPDEVISISNKKADAVYLIQTDQSDSWIQRDLDVPYDHKEYQTVIEQIEKTDEYQAYLDGMHEVAYLDADSHMIARLRCSRQNHFIYFDEEEKYHNSEIITLTYDEVYQKGFDFETKVWRDEEGLIHIFITDSLDQRYPSIGVYSESGMDETEVIAYLRSYFETEKSAEEMSHWTDIFSITTWPANKQSNGLFYIVFPYTTFFLDDSLLGEYNAMMLQVHKEDHYDTGITTYTDGYLIQFYPYSLDFSSVNQLHQYAYLLKDDGIFEMYTIKPDTEFNYVGGMSVKDLSVLEDLVGYFTIDDDYRLTFYDLNRNPYYDEDYRNYPVLLGGVKG